MAARDEHLQFGARTSAVTERELITAINHVEQLGTSMRNISDDIRELRDEIRDDRKTAAKRSDLEALQDQVEDIQRRDSARARDINWMTVIGAGIISAVIWLLQRFVK